MTIMLTGASGLLGQKILENLEKRKDKVIAIYNRNPITPRSPNILTIRLDISKTIELEDLIMKNSPDVIIHTAALTNVDECEVNKEKAWRINVEATRSIVRAAKVVKSYIVYVSTDYVFDGEKGLYTERDLPNPINYYGLTKLIGEELVRSSDLLYTIVRPSAIYGIGGSKKSFAEYVIEKLLRGEEVYALTDQYVSPTLNTLLAEAIIEIIDMKPMGILHVAGERMNRYEFAVKIAETLNLPKDKIHKASIKDMKHWKAKRPRDSSLNTDKAKRLLKTPFYDTYIALDLLKNDLARKQVI